MFKKLTHIISALLTATLLTTTTSALAAPFHQGACSQDYSVQADDWLSKLANKFLGDPLAFPLIVDATNTAAQADNSYANITNPNLIEIGWKLCLPDSLGDAMAAMDGDKDSEAMMDGAMAGKTAFSVRIENIGNFAYRSSGVFNTPLETSEPGPLLPDSTYEFVFEAASGDHLSFATMFVQSNDWFIAPNPSGLPLFNEDGSPASGDITAQLQLWDAGTEIDQEAGAGADQAPRQTGPNTGEIDPDNNVRLVSDANLPAVSDLVNVTLEATGANSFVARIQNVAGASSLPTPFAPGVWVVHGENSAPLFNVGQADFGLGLEALAEDGNPADLAAALAVETGLVTPFAPGVWVTHISADPLFTEGQINRGQGLEALAEDGNPADLAEAIASQADMVSSGVFNTPTGSDGPGPLLPGNAYEFSFEAAPGDYLSFATMLVQSNDLFYAPDGNGIKLFNPDGTPVTGDVTSQVSLWDAGTELNEAPGFGLNQAPRQAGPNTGPDENGVVQRVADGFTYPATASSILVTVSVDK